LKEHFKNRLLEKNFFFFLNLSIHFRWFSGRDNWRRVLRGVGPAQVQLDSRPANRVDGFENDRNVQNTPHARRTTDQGKQTFIVITWKMITRLIHNTFFYTFRRVRRPVLLNKSTFGTAKFRVFTS